MRVLLIGVGTVGEAIGRLSSKGDWCEPMVLADYDRIPRPHVGRSLGGAPRFTGVRIDARDASAITELARAHRADLVMNAVDPQFVMPIFRGALDADANYMDMAVSLSRPHPTTVPLPGLKLGDEQFALAGEWESRGRLALLGMGMDPGLTDVFAAHAAKHLFDEVHEVHIRDGGDLEIPGYAFAPVFSIWTTIEECLNPPIVWEDGAWHTTEPFSAPESFPFPEGIGPVECVNVEHEEVVLMPRWLGRAARPSSTRSARVHRQAQDDPRSRHGPHRQGEREGRRGGAPRRVGGHHARSHQPRRQVPWPGGRGHMGARYQGWEAA